jgi:hypothetical protein
MIVNSIIKKLGDDIDRLTKVISNITKLRKLTTDNLLLMNAGTSHDL